MFEYANRLELGDDVIVVISEGQPGEYENNPTIMAYKEKGYRLHHANMFGCGVEDVGEILIFVPEQKNGK